MHLTKNEIKSDIAAFEDRILEAQAKLAELPTERLPYVEHKERERQQRALISDIAHFNQIIIYATEALDNY